MKRISSILLLSLLAMGLNGQIESEEVNKIVRFNSVQFNALVGSSKIGLGLRYKSLYSINKSLNVGWGVGIESYSSGLERNFIPLSIDAVGDVLESGRTPFYMFSLGYGIPLKEDSDFAEASKGGLMVDVSIGYRSKKNASQPFIAVGYRMQNASYKGQDEFGNSDKEVIYKRWSLSTGILF